jgi:CDP-glucose 4,6-dehydratase
VTDPEGAAVCPTPSAWAGRRVLVTGATGFLGGCLTARLIEYGADVVTIVRGSRPDSRFELEKLRSRCDVVAGDAVDPNVIATAFADPPPMAIFHLAANSDVEDAYQHPADCISSAVVSTLNLLEQVRQRHRSCVTVISSSDKAYGAQAVPYREAQHLMPSHPYEVSKAAQDQIATCYGKVYDLPVAVTRCANYFGAWDFNWRRIIPGTIRSILSRGPVMLRSDGRFTRDFLYIDDAVDAQLLLSERLHADASVRGEAFNFSNEIDVEILEIVRRLCALTGYAGPIEAQSRTQAEIRFMRVDSSKARTVLGWRPTHSLDAALAETVEWYRRFLTGRPT